MVILVIAIGLLYSLPNIYGEDPAVQISGTRGQQATSTTLSDIQNLLKTNNLTPKSTTLENGSILVRFNNTDDQLLAKDKISEKLGQAYSVALNLAPATPKWLTDIGGNPMKWGLDLRGGVRFLMEVDMNTALSKRQEQLQDSLRSELRKERYQYSAIKSGENFSSLVTLTKPEQLEAAQAFLRKQHPSLNVRSINENTISLSLSEASLNETREHAVEQNLTILRKRVEELGVAEPVIQRQGAERIVVELPGVQDTARAKEILGATATLEFRLVNGNVSPDALARGIVPSDTEIKLNREGRPVALFKRTILGGEHITGASSGVDQRSASPQVSVTLDSEGGDIMSATTRDNLHKPMATLYVEYKDSGKKDADGKTLL